MVVSSEGKTLQAHQPLAGGEEEEPHNLKPHTYKLQFAGWGVVCYVMLALPLP